MYRTAFCLSAVILKATASRQTGGLQGGSATDPRGNADESSMDQIELTESEKRQVQKLKQRDREVRAHERAHIAAGAGVVQGGASFTFQRGPDGKMYAVGGEVKIDSSAENDPDKTIRKMQQVKRAALAPAEPSGTDRAVAAQAGRIEAQARQDKIRLEAAEREEEKKEEKEPAFGGLQDRRPYSVEDLGLMVDVSV